MDPNKTEDFTYIE